MNRILAPLCPLGVGVALALGAPAWATAEAPAPIAWSDAQIRAAGIQTESPDRPGAVAGGLMLQGTAVLPVQAVEVVSVPVAGVVQALRVDVAQPVRPGQVMATLQSPQWLEWQREARQAEVQLRLARDKLQRDEQLLAEGVIAEARVRDSRAQIQLAQFSADERRQLLGLAGATPAAQGLNGTLAVSSRVNGQVMEVLAAPGQRLEAGAPLARVARDGALVLELQASATQAASVRIGDRVVVEGCKPSARVTAIAPQLSGGNQSTVLRAAFDGAGASTQGCLRVNQFVTARLDPSGAAMSVPASAVVRQDGQSYVFVRRGGQFQPTPVTLAPGGGARLGVSQGLRSGDAVVVKGTAALKGAWLGLGTEAESTPPTSAASRER